MTDPTTAALQHWLDTHPAPPMPRDVSDYDEETLRRSFGTLSASARREQRRPAATVTDELGFDRRGTYYAAADGRRSA